LDGSYICGAVPRTRLVSFRQEHRTSFKHPIVGLVVGLLMVGASLAVCLLALASLHFLLGSIFTFFFGAYLLWGVVRRHDEPWTVFVLDNDACAFPLKTELTAVHAALLESCCRRQNV